MTSQITVTLVRSTSRQAISVPVVPGQPRLVGSASSSDVRLDEDGVLDAHARIYLSDEGLLVEPLAAATVSLNGRALTEATRLEAGDWLGLGTTLYQLALTGVAPRPSSVAGPPLPNEAITVGRLPDNDVAIDSPLISRRHARIARHGDDWIIEDLDSTNGTFVDGRRIEGRAALRGDERIEFGSYAYVFAGGALQPVEGAGTIRLEAQQLRRTVPDAATGRPRDLLAAIDLAILPGEFVGIFGTSGSGKSTLMDVLNGRRPPTAGAVLYNGEDLRNAFDLFRSTVGYVPQQDIVHRKLPIRRALAYAARLRLPRDTSASEIQAYIDRVLERVEMSALGDQPIDMPPLSGGQLKRVSLAVELVSNPALLFLDEATSGLDAGTDKKMMRLFAQLARDGKTIVCVTHTLENIDACHLVVVLFQGRLVYFGPPDGVLRHFQIPRFADVYDTLETAPAEEWAARYAQSSFHTDFVTRRLSDRPPPVATSAGPARPVARWFDWRQASLLTRRYVDLILCDRRNLLILLAQAPLIGLVVGLVFSTHGTLAERAVAESQVAFMLVISAVWFGCLNSAREIVKELPIYTRERAINLGIGPYVVSKVLPLGALCAIQCIALLAVVGLFLEIPGNMTARAATLFTTGMAATGMGLLVSALVTTTDKAVAMVPILLIPQVILSNAVVRLQGTTEWVAKMTTVAFWGYDSMKATLAEEVRTVTNPMGEALIPVVGSLWGNAIVLLVFFGAFVAATLATLSLRDRRA